ncbi:HAMP domain-containing sensor histidine kinase [Arthrobacter sp. SLBN-112]|uniref:HAMP domain-containing sensor histidine kinase n=1 Tax=Arthrobacter sp. SLBN-112 TaxID=2768452 RepID=UPI0027B3C6A7|nr:HAMP domain-containing sensor histidine kinase [Arthrobacter sp. SLBN-112]MDQ0800108.1 two-component system OmpR family sensor kinase [Arthrobacter sp. SLBN-112]
MEKAHTNGTPAASPAIPLCSGCAHWRVVSLSSPPPSPSWLSSSPAASPFPLIRSAAVTQAREQLSRQADAFSAAPVASEALDLRERHLLGPDNYDLSTITPGGSVTGAAARILSPDEVHQIFSGQEISRTLTKGGVQFLVEARPLAKGGGIVLTRSLADVNAASAQLLQPTLLALAAGLLIAALAGTLLARRLSGPLVRTVAAARRMAEGERTVHLDPAGATEVRAVGEAINTLDHALLASESRQREFLLSISHEIRTPLTALRGYAEALQDGLIPPEDTVRVGQTLSAETDRLDGFVRDLLALARLEADDFTLNIQPVDVPALLKQAQRAWQPAAAQAGVDLTLQLPAPDAGEPLLATTDAQRLRQIIDGLIGNALRVTPPGKPLVLHAGIEAPSPGAAQSTNQQGIVAIQVRDNGPGLTAEDAAVAFHRGALARRYDGQRPTGSGLGLSIAARLAQRMNLNLTVEPTDPAENGACFCIRLPRATSTQP